MGKFRGGGDEVGAALANFINAREDARARANRNEMLRKMDREEATRLQNANGGYNVEGAGGQTNWGNIFNPSNQTSADAAYAEQAPTNVMYSGRTGNGNIDYSFPARQGKEPNDYTFQNAMPTEQNGFHLGDYPQTEMYGDPKDWQRQMVRNAAGLNGDSKWFNPSAFGGAINNAENSGQTEPTFKFTGRTNDTVWKPYQQALTNNPQTPQGQKAIDTFNNQFFDKNVNPSSPAVDSHSAQATDGNNINSVGTTKAYYGKDPNVSDYDARVRDLANAKYLDKQYLDYDQWSRFVNDNGVTNGSLRHVLYEDRVQPLIEQARQERLRESYRIANDPNVDEDTRTQALAALAYDLKKPTLVNDVAWAEEAHQIARDKAMYEMGYLPEGDFGYGDSDGGEYGGEDANAGAIYSHLASKGVPANVIAGIMGNLQAESGFNSSAVGDNGQSIGLAQWYDSRGNNLRNFAQQRGKDWTDIPTQVDFLLSEIQQSNPDLLQRMSKLSPHDAAILFHDEFEKSADSPEMKDRRGQYAEGIYGNRRQGGSRNGRYRRDPYRVSQREQFNYNQQRDAMNYALKNRAIDARLAAKIGAKNGKINSANGLWSSDDDIVGIFNKNALKENPKSGQAMLSIVGQFAPKYRELVQRGLPPEQAKGAIQAALIKQLGADNIANMGQANFNDLMDSIINGTSSVAQQKNNSGHVGASGSNDGSVIDNIKAKGWDVIKNMIPQNRENLNPDPYRDDVEDTAFEKADARRRVIEAARKEGLEFDEYTNELRPIGGRWGNLFNSREKQEEINRKIASFKSRYAI